VRHLGELLGQVAAHPPGGGVLAVQSGVETLQLAEAVEKPVVFLVAHRRAGQHVILVLVAAQKLAEAFGLPPGVI
jgi:hypothetical protein